MLRYSFGTLPFQPCPYNATGVPSLAWLTIKDGKIEKSKGRKRAYPQLYCVLGS